MTDCCSRCDRPSELTIGTEAICGPCWSVWRDELVRGIGGHERIERAFDGGYVATWVPLGAVQAGAHRPDHGPDEYDVACPICSASWVGRIGSRCAWCAEREAAVYEEHRRALLAGPHESETTREWAHRLVDAMKAKIVTEAEIKTAWNREVRRAA